MTAAAENKSGNASRLVFNKKNKLYLIYKGSWYHVGLLTNIRRYDGDQNNAIHFDIFDSFMDPVGFNKNVIGDFIWIITINN